MGIDLFRNFFNRRKLSSVMNRIWLLFLFVGLALLSCNVPRQTSANKAPGKKETDVKNNGEEKQPRRDTAVADHNKGEQPKEEAPKEHKNPEEKQRRKELLNVAVALPMDGSYDAGRFADFINGMTLASRENTPGKGYVKISAVNVGNLNSEDELLRNSAIRNADVLAGGFQTSQVRALAKIAKDKRAPYLSLWNTSEGIVSDNPMYIQLKPSLSAYCNTLANYVAKEMRPDMVYILLESRDSKDATTLDYFTSVYTLNKIAYKVIFADQGEEWKSGIGLYNRIVINIPNWENKSFVTSSLQQLNALKKGRSITVTGMPQWMDWDQTDFSLFESLALHIPVFNYVDETSMPVSIFRQIYFDTYNNWPTTEAYYGYDVVQMIRKLSKHLLAGKDFDPVDHLSGNFFSNYYIKSYKDPNPETGKSVSYYNNSYITIEKFEGGRFVPVQ